MINIIACIILSIVLLYYIVDIVDAYYQIYTYKKIIITEDNLAQYIRFKNILRKLAEQETKYFTTNIFGIRFICFSTLDILNLSAMIMLKEIDYEKSLGKKEEEKLNG